MVLGEIAWGDSTAIPEFLSIWHNQNQSTSREDKYFLTVHNWQLGNKILSGQKVDFTVKMVLFCTGFKIQGIAEKTGLSSSALAGVEPVIISIHRYGSIPGTILAVPGWRNW